MASIKWDVIQGASLRTGNPLLGDDQQKVRRILVSGINTVGTPSSPDPRVLEKLLGTPGMPMIGDPPPPPTDSDLQWSTAGFSLRRHVITPRTANSAWVDLVYVDNATTGFTPGSYLFRRTSYTQNVRTNMIPGTHSPVENNWKNTDDANQQMALDYTLYEYEASFLNLQFSATIYGSPPPALEAAHNCVNHAPWYGYPRGYWRIRDVDLMTTNQGAAYQISASAVTQKLQDWSVWHIMQNKQTGKYVKVSEQTIQEMRDKPYIYGYFRIVDKGIVKIGPYAVVDFTAAFGAF